MITMGRVQKDRAALHKNEIDLGENMFGELQNGESNIRDRVINDIINHVQVMNIKELGGWEEIPFERIDTLRSQSNMTTEELFVLQDVLDNKLEEMRYQMYLEEYYLNNNKSSVG